MGQSAFLAASCATFSQLMLKLAATAVSEGQFLIVLISLCGLSMSAPMHLHLLNETLAGGSVAMAVPFYQTMLIILSAVSGGVLFDEFSQLSFASKFIYGTGVCIATSGLVLLSGSASPLDEVRPDDEMVSSEEDAPPTIDNELWRITEEEEDSQKTHKPAVSKPRKSRRRSSLVVRGCIGGTRRSSALLATGFGFGHALSEVMELPGLGAPTLRSRAVSVPFLPAARSRREFQPASRSARSISIN